MISEEMKILLKPTRATYRLAAIQGGSQEFFKKNQKLTPAEAS